MVVTIAQPVLLSATVSQTNVSCNGGNNGTASVTPNGGTPPYQYSWSNGEVNSAIIGLAAGSYSVQITDANGCIHIAVININQQSPVQLLANSANPSCYGYSNGYINISASGGVAPYTYAWSNGEISQNLTNIAAGTYVVNVIDVNHCEKTETVIITQPDSLYGEITGYIFSTGYNVSPYGGSNGSITLIVEGGTNPYDYIWSNGSTTQNLENIPAGLYAVIITDNQGCKDTVAIALNQPLVLEMPTALSPNGDNQNDYFVVHGLDIYPDNEIQIFNRWGDEVYNKKGYMNEWNGEGKDGISLPDATYFVILKVRIGDTDRVLTGYVDVRK
jgi:gliding motility-associated-like protein